MKKIELRKISHNERLSEETNAYAAQVWVDGVHVCDVSNHGTGGCDEQHPAKGKTNADVAALNDYIKTTYPKEAYDFGEGHKGESEQDLETVCGHLLADHLITKDLQRLLKRTVAYFDPKDKSIRSYKGKAEGVQRAHLITLTLRKTPDAIILNKLPFADALQLFKPAA